MAAPSAASAPARMMMSPIGEAVLIAREGRRLTAYLDTANPPVWTIGIGCTTIDGVPVRKGMTITSAQCDALFARTLARYVAAVNAGLKVPVGQHAFDALVSICFNIGIGTATPRAGQKPGFLGSSFLKRLNAGDVPGARAGILMWQKPASIITRRQAEADQFVTPYLSALPSPTRGARPVRVAAPVPEVLHAAVPTPVIVPIAPPVAARPTGLKRLFLWIDDTWGEGARASTDDAVMPGRRAA